MGSYTKIAKFSVPFPLASHRPTLAAWMATKRRKNSRKEITGQAGSVFVYFRASSWPTLLWSESVAKPGRIYRANAKRAKQDPRC